MGVYGEVFHFKLDPSEISFLTTYINDDTYQVSFSWKLEFGVPRNTCDTCPGSFRKLTKGNNSKNIDARVMDLVHGSCPL